MKQIFTLALIVLGCASTYAGAEISFDQKSLDFGEIVLNADAASSFSFTNTGDEPLIISNCKAPCGCTVPVCPMEVIMPGDSGEIAVSYNRTNIAGSFTKSFTVSSNSSTPTVVLKISGTVVD